MRKFAKLENVEEVVNLLNESWETKNGFLVYPYSENKVALVDQTDDTYDIYVGQGFMIRSEHYDSKNSYVEAVIKELDEDRSNQTTNGITSTDASLPKAYETYSLLIDALK